MVKTKYITVGFILTILVIGSLWFFKPPVTPSQIEPLRVGILKHESTLPFYVAEEFDLFHKHNLQVQLIELPPGDHVPALLADRVDVISPTSFPALFGIVAQHPDLLYAVFPGAEVTEGQTVYGLVVKSDNSSQGVKDLRGGVIIAINPYTKVNVQMILNAAGLPKNSWPEIRVASREAALQAVADSTAEAAIMDQPALAVALASQGYRLLEANPRAKYIGSPYWSGSGAVKRSTWAARNEDFQRLTAAIDESVKAIRTDSGAAHRILAARLGLRREIADQIGGYYFPLTNEAVPKDGIEKTVDAIRAAGLLESSISLKQFFPPDYYGEQ